MSANSGHEAGRVDGPVVTAVASLPMGQRRALYGTEDAWLPSRQYRLVRAGCRFTLLVSCGSLRCSQPDEPAVPPPAARGVAPMFVRLQGSQDAGAVRMQGISPGEGAAAAGRLRFQ